jgi:hypothetical protein
MQAKKVIIATDVEYTPKHEPLLNGLYERRIELFCAWGKHCEQWELAMDLFVTDPVRFDESRHITTTSHSDESFEDVMNMAECWSVENGSNEVEVIQL